MTKTRREKNKLQYISMLPIASMLLFSFTFSCLFAQSTTSTDKKTIKSELTKSNPPLNKKNENKEFSNKIDKNFDPALTATIFLFKRQACLDFMNIMTKSKDYVFRWRNPADPKIGIFLERETGIPGCGQISLPIDAGKKSPHPFFPKVIFNQRNDKPGMLQILSKKLTKDVADINSVKPISAKPLIKACLHFDNAINNNPSITNKVIKSFGDDTPDFPLKMPYDSIEIKAFKKRLDDIVKAALDQGCDGRRKKREARSSSRGVSSRVRGVRGARGAAGSGRGASALIRRDDADTDSSRQATTTSSQGGQFDIPGAGGGYGGSGRVARGRGLGSGGGLGRGTTSTDPAAVAQPVDNGCPENDPNCNQGNSNCPPGDPNCNEQPGSDVPDSSNCPTNLIEQCIPGVFKLDSYQSKTNITQYSPQTGFIFNLPNPGGEYHTKVVTINGQQRVLDMSIPCKASVTACQEAYSRWFDYSLNRQLLHNVQLDYFDKAPDQLWVFPSTWDDEYVPYYNQAVDSARSSLDPVQRNNRLPYGPMNN